MRYSLQSQVQLQDEAKISFQQGTGQCNSYCNWACGWLIDSLGKFRLY